MSTPAASTSPKIVLAIAGAAVAVITFAGACVTLLLGLIALGGILISYGGWKNGVDQKIAAQDSHIVAVETAWKEQTAALKETTDKQIAALTASTKDMVTAVKDSTDKRLTSIEDDRRVKIEGYQRDHAETEARSTKLETLLTNQQKQIDFLTTLAGDRRPAAR